MASSPSRMLSATVRTGHEHEVLVDHADAAVDGVRWAGDLDGLPVEQDLARVRRGQAVEDVHERRLAGAVLAEQGVDLAGPHVEVDAVVGDDARVALGDAAHLERRRADALGRQGGVQRGHVAGLPMLSCLGYSNGPALGVGPFDKDSGDSWKGVVYGSVCTQNAAALLLLAGLERAVGQRRFGSVKRVSGLRGDEALEVMEGREAHVLGVDAQAQDAALVRAGRDALDGVGDVLGQLLLGADDRAGGRLRGGEELVDVHADAVDARVAGGLEDAVAGLAGDLEHDVDVGSWASSCWAVDWPPAGSLKAAVSGRAGHVDHRHDGIRVDGLGAVGVALDVVDDGRDDGRAADGGDVAASR